MHEYSPSKDDRDNLFYLLSKLGIGLQKVIQFVAMANSDFR